MKAKNLTALLIGGVLSAVAAVAAVIGRFAIASEMEGIKNSIAMIVMVGSEQMSREDYMQLAAQQISYCTIGAVVTAVLAAVLLAAYFLKKKKSQSV